MDVIIQKKATIHLYTFLVSKMISSLGANVYTFGISMYILAMTGSAFSFAANLIFSIIPRTIISPIAGILVDRYSRKSIVLLGQLGVILSITSLLIFSMLAELSLLAIYVTTIIYSISSTFSMIAFTASIGNLVDPSRIQKAMSFNQLSLSIAGIGGPLIGGMLFGFVSVETFFMINIVAYVMAFLLESTLDFKFFSNSESIPNSKESVFQSMKASVAYVKTKPVISKLLMLIFWLNLFFASVTVGASFIFVEVLEIEYKLVGMIEAAGAVGMLLMALYLARRSKLKYPLLFSKRALLALSLLVGAYAIPLITPLPAGSVFFYYLLNMFLFGSSLVLTNTPIGIIIQTEVEESYRGRIYGIIEMCAMALTPLGTLIFGLLYDVIPAQYILIICSIALALTIFFLMPSTFIHSIYPELKRNTSSNPHEVFEKKKQFNECNEKVDEIKRTTNPTTHPFR
ncbi:MFS transporter [Lysinibacillus antri]|uniref:Multidrug efflux pump Tap n=1 Tax=Lysinibacillus antri TaxID=2498145 RepID=A0A432LBM0_9BACI|nr:MFS transporter [Lysinibacillus antri]RUL52172.1 MFS transporter [Lysinibacillus antri]